VRHFGTVKTLVARLLRMPDVAPDGESGVLAGWLVEETSAFDASQTIAYVETEDSLLSVEAGRPGVLLKALVAPGDVVDSGTPIGVLGDPGERVDDVDDLLMRLGIGEPPVPVDQVDDLPEDPIDPFLDEPLVPAEGLGSVFHPHPLGGVEVLAPMDPPAAASPRRRARLVELDSLGTGAEEDEETVPHLVLRTTVRAEPLLRLHADIDSGTTSATLGDLVVKMVATAFEIVPELAVVEGATRNRYIDVSLAVPGPKGTVTPVVRDAGSLSLSRLAATTRDLVARAAEGRLDPTEADGGLVEVTDLAAYGVSELIASVSPPHVAHLAFGTVRDEPVVEDGELVPGKVVTLTLSVDHERVDRLVAAQWLAAFVDLLRRPARALV
jgi:pyruvate dehydrogenase E2 component (dihydrolipoamide acetyltransferase)